MTPGLIATAVVLVVTVTAGLLWRRNNGRMRDPQPVSGVRPAGAPDPAGAAPAPTPPSVSRDDLGQELGSRATLLLFSSAFCAPCRATRRVLAEVAAMTDGVTQVEIDAESHLDLVRRLGVWRTPTVFVLGPDGRIRKRASGQPRKADVIAALGAVPGLGSTYISDRN